MPRAKGPSRPAKQLHVLLKADEHRRLNVVAANEGVKVSALVRDLFFPEIDRRYAALVGRKRGTP